MTVEVPALLAAALVLAAKVTLLLGLAALASVALRHHGAAARHGVWALAVAGVLALPTLGALPFARWDVPVPFAFGNAAPAAEWTEMAPPAPADVAHADALAARADALAAEADAHVAHADALAAAADSHAAHADALAAHADALAAGHPAPLPPAAVTPVAYVEAQPALFEGEPALAPVAPEAPAAMTWSADAPPAAASLAGTGTMARTLFWTWLAGCLAVLGWMAAGRLGLAALGRRARPVEGEEWMRLLKDAVWMLDIGRPVRLLRSEEATMPMAWGILRPVVLLPAEADEWPEEQRTHVLLHELSHVARHDALTQLLAGLACALHWFNPAVWYASRRLRVERERACDERVLSLGAEPKEYAQHLLELARRFRPLRSAPLVSVTMARPSHLEGRMLAILNHVRGAGRLSRAASLGGLAVGAAAILTLGAMRPVPAQAATAGTPAAAEAEAPPASALAADGAYGDTTFHATLDGRVGGTLELDLRTGASVRITGGDGDDVEIRGRLAGRDWRSTDWNVTTNEGVVRLETFFRDDGRSHSTSHALEIRVPRRQNVRISSAGGEVTIRGVEGTFRGETGGGEIELADLRGSARLSTGGGDVTVSDCVLDGTVSTGGGRVLLRNVRGGLRGSSGSDVAHGIDMDLDLDLDGDVAWDAETAAQMQAEIAEAQRELQAEMAQLDAEMRAESREAQREAIHARREALQAQHEVLAELDAEGIRAEDLQALASLGALEGLRALENLKVLGEDVEVHLDEGDVAQLVGAATRMGLQAARDGLEAARVAMREEGVVLDGDAPASTVHVDRDGVRRVTRAGGAIRVDSAPRGAELITGGGDVTVGASRGRVQAATGGGAVRVGPAQGSVEAGTGSGDVTIVVDRRGGAGRVIEAGTGNGTVTIVLPRGMGATLDLETAYTRGREATRIRGADGVAVTATTAWDDRQGTPRRYVRARGRIDGGGPTIRVRAVNGDVVIRRS